MTAVPFRDPAKSLNFAIPFVLLDDLIGGELILTPPAT